MQQQSWFARLLYRFTGNLRCRVINGNQGEPYLERYHLFRLPGGGGVYIHRFVDSDPDRGLHDHPWKAASSLILHGAYKELRLEKSDKTKHVSERILSSGRLNLLNGHDFHRIVLLEKSPVWTLFAHTGKFKDWGFMHLHDNGDTEYSPHEKVTNEQNHALWWKNAPRGKYVARSAKILDKK